MCEKNEKNLAHFLCAAAVAALCCVSVRTARGEREEVVRGEREESERAGTTGGRKEDPEGERIYKNIY